MEQKCLFVVDLDGTLLKDSTKATMEKDDILAIKKLTAKGHIVCIATGRPWRSTEKTYKQLGLKTLVANYNGAHIHNPSDYSFIPHISYMNLNDVLYVKGDKKIQKSIANIAVEGPSWVMIDKRDKHLEQVFGFSKARNLKEGFDVHKLPLPPTGVIFDTKPGVHVKKLDKYLKRKYGDLAEFSWWNKGEGLTPVFDMTSVGTTKANALSLMARYYDIPMERTIAIGDGYNDVSMFKIAELSVAMANSDEKAKVKATYVIDKTNKQAGVAQFINNFLSENPDKIIEKLKAKKMVNKT